MTKKPKPKELTIHFNLDKDVFMFSCGLETEH